jgi:hypothetical protein
MCESWVETWDYTATASDTTFLCTTTTTPFRCFPSDEANVHMYMYTQRTLAKLEDPWQQLPDGPLMIRAGRARNIQGPPTLFQHWQFPCRNALFYFLNPVEPICPVSVEKISFTSFDFDLHLFVFYLFPDCDASFLTVTWFLMARHPTTFFEPQSPQNVSPCREICF